jgi:hypothetical protein
LIQLVDVNPKSDTIRAMGSLLTQYDSKIVSMLIRIMISTTCDVLQDEIDIVVSAASALCNYMGDDRILLLDSLFQQPKISCLIGAIHMSTSLLDTSDQSDTELSSLLSHPNELVSTQALHALTQVTDTEWIMQQLTVNVKRFFKDILDYIKNGYVPSNEYVLYKKH